VDAEAPRRASARAGAAGEAARRYGRTASLLSVAVGATGFMVYLYFAFASRALDPTEYGQITVLWVAIYFIVATVYRPVEQLLSRTIAERHARERFRGRPLRVAATIEAGIALTITAAALILRDPIQDELLEGDATLYWIFVVALVAYAVSFFARGYFAGHRRFGLYSVVLLADALARVAFPLAVLLGIASGQSAVAIGMIAGPLTSLAVLPVIVRAVLRGRASDTEAAGPPDDGQPPSPQLGSAAPARPAPGADMPEFTLAHGWGFAGSVLLIMLSEQVFLSSGALFVFEASGAAAAGFIWNVLMLARAPVYVFQAVATSLLPHLTRLRYRSEAGSEEAFGLSVQITLTAVLALAVGVALVVLVAGPTLMQVAFGDNFSYDRAGLLIVTVGMGFYLGAATLTQAALAQGQARRAAIRWIACATAFVLWNLLPVLDEFRRVEVGFAGAGAALCGLLYMLYRSPPEHPEDVVRPDSPEEIEARIAAADEAG
jgi:O-antigen/teichoic acid export membrane protein